MYLHNPSTLQPAYYFLPMPKNNWIYIIPAHICKILWKFLFGKLCIKIHSLLHMRDT